MPKGQRVTPAHWVCVDCQTEGIAYMTGVVPTRCKPCKSARLVARNREARRSNPEAASRYQRDYRLRRYGIGPLEYERMVERADGRCEACGDAGELHIDHCHKRRRGRGLLCPACNKALGLLKDDPARCDALAEYLRSR